MTAVAVLVAFLIGFSIPFCSMIGGVYYFKKHPDVMIKAVAKMARKSVRRAAQNDDRIPG